MSESNGKSIFENMAAAGEIVLDLLNKGWSVDQIKANMIERGIDPAELETARVRNVFRTAVIFQELGY